MSKRREEPYKECKECKAQLKRKRYDSGRLEGYQIYMKRKYCDLFCANAKRRW